MKAIVTKKDKVARSNINSFFNIIQLNIILNINIELNGTLVR